MRRFSIKFGGESGQGIKVTAKILYKAFKTLGLYVFAYSEYPSLIKGGHNTFQIDLSDNKISSVSEKYDLGFFLNKNSADTELKKLKPEGTVFLDETTKNSLENQNMNARLVAININEIILQSNLKQITKNTVFAGLIWKFLDLDINILKNSIIRVFSNKKTDLVEENIKAAFLGFNSTDNAKPIKNFFDIKNLDDKITISGSEAITLGVVASGVRFYSAYPMTPTTGILQGVSSIAKQKKIVVKQAEDEIMVANMALGAMHMGIRALCATSGGGFDLMTETLSLSGITETPFVVILGQRPGPATGVPTWTAQSDLDVAIYGGHGEFERIVIAPSSPLDSYYLLNEAFNLAEKFQVPVIVLTDKYLNESVYTIDTLDSSLKRFKDSFGTEKRYRSTESGVSPRWFPGDINTPFLSNSDEHTEEGFSTEEEDEIEKQIFKRNRKINSIIENLPEPSLTGESENIIVCWGSVSEILKDIYTNQEEKNFSILSYTYVFPLKTDLIQSLFKSGKKLFLVENNLNGLFGKLLESKGIIFKEKILKSNGRPFYFEELSSKINLSVNKHQ